MNKRIAKKILRSLGHMKYTEAQIRRALRKLGFREDNEGAE